LKELDAGLPSASLGREEVSAGVLIGVERLLQRPMASMMHLVRPVWIRVIVRLVELEE